jgi:hypothetical protein
MKVSSVTTTELQRDLSPSTVERGRTGRKETSNIGPMDRLVELNPVGAAELSCSSEESPSFPKFFFKEGFYSARPIGQSKVLDGTI